MQQIVSSLIPVLVGNISEVVALAEEGLKFLALLHAGEGTGEIVVAVRWKRRRGGEVDESMKQEDETG